MHSAYSQPYAQFEAEHNLQLNGLFPATVVGIDGNRINAGQTPPVRPGAHTIQVEMRLQHDAYNPEQRSLSIDAKPCTRYYIASRNAGDGRFEAVVSTTEPIKECQKLMAKADGGM
jgi:hypothetical protein